MAATRYLFIYDLPILSVAVALPAPLLLLFPGQPAGVPLMALLMLLIVLRLRQTPKL